MNHVYVVMHVHAIGNDEDDMKFIGVYSSRREASKAVQQLRKQPGFRETPDGFHVERYELNEDHWTEGFITVK